MTDRDVDDRAASIRREHRREGAAHGERAEVVDLDLGAGIGERLGLADQGAVAVDPGVVDKQRHVGAAFGRPRHLFGVGHVERERDDSRVAGEFAELRRIARSGIDPGRPRRQQAVHDAASDAAIGAGDEDGRVGYVHGAYSAGLLSAQRAIRRLDSTLVASSILRPTSCPPTGRPVGSSSPICTSTEA